MKIKSIKKKKLKIDTQVGTTCRKVSFNNLIFLKHINVVDWSNSLFFSMFFENYSRTLVIAVYKFISIFNTNSSFF